VNGEIRGIIGAAAPTRSRRYVNGSGTQTIIATNGSHFLERHCIGARALVTIARTQTIGHHGIDRCAPVIAERQRADLAALHPPHGCASPCLLTERRIEHTSLVTGISDHADPDRRGKFEPTAEGLDTEGIGQEDRSSRGGRRYAVERSGRTARRPLVVACAALARRLLCASAPLAAQPIGDVVHVQGIASAQRPGEPARFLQKGDALNEGDVINTAARGYAVIQLKDDSKITLRPDTTFAIPEYRQGTANEGMLVRLLKGGMRAVTGLMAKRNPQSVRINAGTATIGIRGTSFDARLCGTECAQEGRTGDRPAVSLAQQEAIVARIAVTSAACRSWAPTARPAGR
jgi:hypothetical protein